MTNNTTEKHPQPDVTIESCDREQIHIPGTVQSFGCLIACDTEVKITRATENVKDLVGFQASDLIGKSLESVLKPDQFQLISDTIKARRDPVVQMHFANGNSAAAMVRFVGDEFYLDILPRGEGIDGFVALRQFVNAISSATSQTKCAQVIAEEIRKIAQFDRVKVYKFDSNWNGEVIAESRVESVPSYKGLNFPESDIPKQARELYVRNRVRVIGDINDPQSAIVQKSGSKPLDLSFSFIRSVSPIHLQYLRNMDVIASMSISLFQGGKFWGLVACHHYSPKIFTGSEEPLYQTISDLASNRLNELKQAEDAENKKRSLEYLHSIVPTLRDGSPDMLLNDSARLDSLITATGVAISLNGNIYKKNAVPDEPTLQTLVEWLERGSSPVFYCDDLPARFGDSIGTYASGLLAVKVGGSVNGWLMWFRMEITEEVKWAGDPYQPKSDTKYGDRLYPRTSFSLWKETKRGHARPWTMAEIEAATEIAKLMEGSGLVAREAQPSAT